MSVTDERIRQTAGSLRRAIERRNESHICALSRVLCAGVIRHRPFRKQAFDDVLRLLSQAASIVTGEYHRNVQGRHDDMLGIQRVITSRQTSLNDSYLTGNALARNLRREWIREDDADVRHGIPELSKLTKDCLEHYVELDHRIRGESHNEAVRASFALITDRLTKNLELLTDKAASKSELRAKSLTGLERVLGETEVIAKSLGVDTGERPMTWDTELLVAFETCSAAAPPSPIDHTKDNLAEQAKSGVVSLRQDVTTHPSEDSMMLHPPSPSAGDQFESLQHLRDRLDVPETTFLQQIMKLFAASRIDLCVSAADSIMIRNSLREPANEDEEPYFSSVGRFLGDADDEDDICGESHDEDEIRFMSVGRFLGDGT